MYRYLGGPFLVVAASALMIGSSTMPVAAATSTWTVTPGGSFQTYQPGHSSNLTDTTTGIKFPCTGVYASGTFKSGSGLTNPIGTITGISTVLCGADGLAFSITFSSLHTKIRAVTYDATTSRIHGAVLGLNATLAADTGSPACAVTMDGTAPGARNGMVRFQYLNPTSSDRGGELVTYKKQTNLHAYNVSGCNGLINSGDTFAWGAWFWIDSTNGSVVNTIASP
jgi:hypothetical protein